MDEVRDLANRIYHKCHYLLPNAEHVEPVKDYQKFLTSLYTSCEMGKPIKMTLSFIKQKIKQADGIILASKTQAQRVLKEYDKLPKADAATYNKQKAQAIRKQLQHCRLQMKYVKELKAYLVGICDVIKAEKASNQSQYQNDKVNKDDVAHR